MVIMLLDNNNYDLHKSQTKGGKSWNRNLNKKKLFIYSKSEQKSRVFRKRLVSSMKTICNLHN